MDRIIYRRAYSSYICIENCRGEYNTIYYYMHACMIPICLGTSYQVHSYLFSFFMRESFSSCIHTCQSELGHLSLPDKLIKPHGQQVCLRIEIKLLSLHCFNAGRGFYLSRE